MQADGLDQCLGLEGLAAAFQRLEAEALVEAVRLHLDDAVSVYHGRTEFRDEVDRSDYRLGLPDEAQSLRPAEPRDGAGLEYDVDVDIAPEAPESAEDD